MKTKTTDPATDLRGKIAEADEKRLKLMAERDEIAFSAVVEREPKAIKRVAEISTELGRLADEVSTLTAALNEAGRRDAAAAAEKRDAEECGKAEKALALLDEFVKEGAELEAAADALVEKFNALCKKSRQLTALGYAPATPTLVDVNMATALKSKLMSTGLQIEHIAPGARRTFGGVIASWSDNVRARATARLASKSKTTVAQHVLAAEPGTFALNAGSASLAKAG
jgi:hypothetical protein